MIVIKGMEIIPSEPEAIRGKSFSLKCRWKLPRHISPLLDNPWLGWPNSDGEDTVNWFWSAAVDQGKTSSEELSYKNFGHQLGVYNRLNKSRRIILINYQYVLLLLFG